MTNHTAVRLEKHFDDGTTDVVAYFAPNFEVRPSFSNDLFTATQPNENPAVARDNRTYSHEVEVSGSFEHSDNLPAAHASDVESLVGSTPATARDQVNRLVYYATQVGGPFRLYEGADEYTATTASDVDVANGVFPVVQIDQIDPPSEGGIARQEYSVSFVVGVPR